MVLSFHRQQSLHLGLLNVTVENSNEPLAGNSSGDGNGGVSLLANDTTPIIENKQSTNSSMPINSTSVLKYAIPEPNVSNFQSNITMIQATVSMQNQTISDENVNSTTNISHIIDTTSRLQTNQSDDHRHKRSMSSNSLSPITLIPSDMQQHNSSEILRQTTDTKSQSNSGNITNSNFKSNDIQKATVDNGGKTNTRNSMAKGTKKNRNDAIIGHISVLIHNISVISNVDRDYDGLEKEWTSSALG